MPFNSINQGFGGVDPNTGLPLAQAIALPMTAQAPIPFSNRQMPQSPANLMGGGVPGSGAYGGQVPGPPVGAGPQRGFAPGRFQGPMTGFPSYGYGEPSPTVYPSRPMTGGMGTVGPIDRLGRGGPIQMPGRQISQFPSPITGPQGKAFGADMDPEMMMRLMQMLQGAFPSGAAGAPNARR